MRRGEKRREGERRREKGGEEEWRGRRVKREEREGMKFIFMFSIAKPFTLKYDTFAL